MIYTRAITSDTIQDRLDLDLALLSPTDQQELLLIYASMMLDTANAMDVIIWDNFNFLNGYGPMPEQYNITCYTPRICVFVEGKAMNYPTTFCWYDKDNNQIIQQAVVKKDSLCFVRVPEGASRLVYDGKIVFLNCLAPTESYLFCFFIDLWGLPQCIKLMKNNYQYGYEAEGSYRPYNGQLQYEYHKVATNQLVVGDEGIDTDLRLFCDGFCASPAYYAYFKEKFVKCSVIGGSVTSDKFANRMTITATMQVTVGEALRLEDNYNGVVL